MSFTCKGTVVSAIINGDADISVTADALKLTSLIDSVNVFWADVVSIEFKDYTLFIRAKKAEYILSKLGQSGEPLYNHALSAYGDKVRKCMFVSGQPAAKAKGDVIIHELSPQPLRGVAVEVYNDCVLSLPNDLSARRAPLSFVNGFSDNDFTISLTTMDGKKAEYSKLGYDHAPVSKAVQDGIRALRAKMTDQITDLDPRTESEQASQLSRLMPGGLAAPMGLIRGIAPTFAAALEEKIAESRAAETYKVFKEISGPDEVCVGFKPEAQSFGSGEEDPLSQGAEGEGANAINQPGELPDQSSADESTADESGAEKPGYMLWIAAPSPAGNSCAIEFAGAESDAAATFVYRFEGPWNIFRIRLGMALEAIAWKREVIRLTEEEMGKPENDLYRMAEDRNESLRLIRSSFAGRAIHRSLESWKSQVNELL